LTECLKNEWNCTVGTESKIGKTFYSRNGILQGRVEQMNYSTFWDNSPPLLIKFCQECIMIQIVDIFWGPFYLLLWYVNSRPQSAVQGREAEKKLKIALHRMSPELAGMIQDALGPRPPSTSLTTPKGLARPQSAHPVMDSVETRVQTTQPIHITFTTEVGIEDTQAAARLSNCK